MSAAVRAVGRRWDPDHVDALVCWASDVRVEVSDHSVMSCSKIEVLVYQSLSMIPASDAKSMRRIVPLVAKTCGVHETSQ